MSEFVIKDEDLKPLAGQVVVLTGCSSGIGLATVELLLSLDAIVVGGDLNPAPIEHAHFAFVTTDVSSWKDLSALFRTAMDLHGRVDHAFANAGIAARTAYLEEKLDDEGNLLEPDHKVLDVNLKGVVNTVALAVHHMRRDLVVAAATPTDPVDGSSSGSGRASGSGAINKSIVLTASATSFQRFRATDYAVSKHGVLGLMRGLYPHFLDPKSPEDTSSSTTVPSHSDPSQQQQQQQQQPPPPPPPPSPPKLAIRINAIAPSWTQTAIIPAHVLPAIGAAHIQPATAPARTVAHLMADRRRHGQLIYSYAGRFVEVEEALLLPAVEGLVGAAGSGLRGGEDGTLARLRASAGTEQ